MVYNVPSWLEVHPAFKGAYRYLLWGHALIQSALDPSIFNEEHLLYPAFLEHVKELKERPWAQTRTRRKRIDPVDFITKIAPRHHERLAEMYLFLREDVISLRGTFEKTPAYRKVTIIPLLKRLLCPADFLAAHLEMESNLVFPWIKKFLPVETRKDLDEYSIKRAGMWGLRYSRYKYRSWLSTKQLGNVKAIYPSKKILNKIFQATLEDLVELLSPQQERKKKSRKKNHEKNIKKKNTDPDKK